MQGDEVVLTLVTDRRRMALRPLAGLVAEAARAGVERVQLREKDLGGAALRALAAAAVAACAGTSTRVLVNGRPDVAEAVGAHGVQLPEHGLPVAGVRRAFPGLELGASRHSLEGAQRAQDEGADFVLLGPVFATPGKERAALGPQVLEQVVRVLGIPVHAIGGIDAATAPIACRAGARGLAAIRCFLERPMDMAVAGLRAGARA
jgi:thiamine-phosphate diphosphorylase